MRCTRLLLAAGLCLGTALLGCGNGEDPKECPDYAPPACFDNEPAPDGFQSGTAEMVDDGDGCEMPTCSCSEGQKYEAGHGFNACIPSTCGETQEATEAGWEKDADGCPVPVTS